MATDIQQFDLFANGKFHPAGSGKYFDSINPSNGEVFAKVADATLPDIQKAISAARRKFDSSEWSGLTVTERGKYLVKIAELIRANAKVLAELETLSTGKTTKQSTFIDVPTCADTFEYFGNLPDEILKPEVNPVPAPVKSVTLREPMGVVGCIIPWNYPLIMAAWKMAPALIAGNTIVFKPSRQASVSILKLAQLIQDAGIPAGVVNVVTSTDHNVAEELVKGADVNMVSFTGGTETGKKLMELASGTVKRISLELGGKSPSIVLADCDLEAAVGGIMSSIFMNQGQMCTAGSRLLVEDKIHDEFVAKLVEKTKALKIGPATNYDTDFGPVVSREQRDKIKYFIDLGPMEGARIVCGGDIPTGGDLDKGFYIEPTIMTQVKNSMRIAQEEIFGPVLVVMKFSNIDEAIKIANDSPFGLAATIWSKDIEKAKRIATKIQSGIVWINTYGGFYNEASFGGYKQSGSGRELGKEGVLEYTQSKHVCIDQTPGGKPLVCSWF